MLKWKYVVIQPQDNETMTDTELRHKLQSFLNYIVWLHNKIVEGENNDN